MNTEVNYTPEKVIALRTAYENAVREGKEIFSFDGNDYVQGYAKYLLEYLEGVIGPREQPKK